VRLSQGFRGTIGDDLEALAMRRGMLVSLMLHRSIARNDRIADQSHALPRRAGVTKGQKV
jgi:hypothetical protein